MERNNVESMLAKLDLIKAEYLKLKKEHDLLKSKYDAILATEDGHSSQTENVWQSGYAAGHDAATAKHKSEFERIQKSAIHYANRKDEVEKDHATLRARCERMERALSWYADDGNYLGDNGELSTTYKNKMPNKAREALGHPSEPDYPKLTPEQIQERKEAIEWIRNPAAGGMRWVKASERLPDDKKRNYIFRQAGNTRSARTIYLDYCPNIPALLQLPIENIEWLDEGKEELNDWISVDDKLPTESGRYWCYVEHLTDIGISHFQWNCDYNAQLRRFSDMTLTDGEHVTHWRKLPEPPKLKEVSNA
jgi:hypothetical protein